MYYTLKIDIKIDSNDILPDAVLGEVLADELQDAPFQLTSFEVLEVND